MRQSVVPTSSPVAGSVIHPLRWSCSLTTTTSVAVRLCKRRAERTICPVLTSDSPSSSTEILVWVEVLGSLTGGRVSRGIASSDRPSGRRRELRHRRIGGGGPRRYRLPMLSELDAEWRHALPSAESGWVRGKCPGAFEVEQCLLHVVPDGHQSRIRERTDGSASYGYCRRGQTLFGGGQCLSQRAHWGSWPPRSRQVRKF